ncbi:CoA transferase, partial [Streptomyces sp. CBMA29]|uniref:CoA transferase n=1 Tax=Streptomyces sp. CBMA29 TaxID=1896314 RepID=UPI002948C010
MTATVAGPRTTAAGPRTTAATRVVTAAPSVRGGAPATAVHLAVAHLRALGCGTEQGRSGAFTAHSGRVRARCEVSWAGPVDLPLAGEADVQAACGLTHVHGRRYGGPTPLGVDYASCVAGALAATGTLAALAAGPADDGGEIRVTTSVAQAALLSVGQYLAAATAADDRPEPRTPGGPPFAAADGVRFELETLDPEAWRGFWSALG